MPIIGGDLTANPTLRKYQTVNEAGQINGCGQTYDPNPQPNEYIAYNASVFETSIGETAGAPTATTGIGLTPIVIVGGLLLLLFMMTKGRF